MDLRFQEINWTSFFTIHLGLQLVSQLVKNINYYLFNILTKNEWLLAHMMGIGTLRCLTLWWCGGCTTNCNSDIIAFLGLGFGNDKNVPDADRSLIFLFGWFWLETLIAEETLVVIDLLNASWFSEVVLVIGTVSAILDNVWEDWDFTEGYKNGKNSANK